YIGNDTYKKAAGNFTRRANTAASEEKVFGTTQSYKEAKLRSCIAQQLNNINLWSSYTLFDDFVRDYLDLYCLNSKQLWIEDINLIDSSDHHIAMVEEKAKRNIRVNEFTSEVITEMLQEAETWTW
ncbi:hypothetical protein KAR91_19495, partial [Candidatus Pacearchaeota archaeon]|nr:hypothetical protein [Candidatus Pacearchaeota archaeon]